MKRSPLEALEAELRDLESRSLLRRPTQVAPGQLTFCSNDYLGLASSPARAHAPVGAGASRLVSGNTDHHADLERELCAWLGVEASLVFTSGYAANVGALAALLRPGDRVLSDALNHASIIDGVRLARAEVEVYPHLDVGYVKAALQARPDTRTWVVTESYFGMDADAPDLQALGAACTEAGAGYYVDEAHALGVYGSEGRGRCADVGVVPDVLVGTLGKALGAGGAFVAGSATLHRWLWNRARSFVFSTGLSPLVAAEAATRVREARAMDEARARLHARAAQLRAGLRDLGCQVLGEGPVVPWVLGDARRAVDAAAALQSAGYFVQAIRPPTVPAGSARLRLSVRASHTPEEVHGLLSAVRATRETWAASSS
ncbi:MAG TPA: 8-amino-7-oxononanoate synthase [Polyangiaceae bacterium]|nr:8-amino-7-oxononanoate synthase [Polyangiaceae bacterium]